MGPGDRSELKCQPAAVAEREGISWRALQVPSAVECRGLSWYHSRAAASSDTSTALGAEPVSTAGISLSNPQPVAAGKKK